MVCVHVWMKQNLRVLSTWPRTITPLKALMVLKGTLSKGYLKKFDSLEELQRFVGGQPVLSKLGCIKKMKVNPDTKQYIQKVRIILD